MPLPRLQHKSVKARATEADMESTQADDPCLSLEYAFLKISLPFFSSHHEADEEISSTRGSVGDISLVLLMSER